LEGEGEAVEPLKRLGRLLEDDHLLFDLLLDHQLEERGPGYDALVLPEVRRLSIAEGEVLRQLVARGKALVFTAGTGTARPEGSAHAPPLLSEWRVAPGPGRVTAAVAGGRVLYLPSGPWEPEVRQVREGAEVPVYPPRARDRFGAAFAEELSAALGASWLRTTAPWWVRVRAWLPEREVALVLHWVNYRQDEDSAVEVPMPEGPFEVECRPPAGHRVVRVEWRYPEMRAPQDLPHELRGDRVRFTVPQLIVYGLAVLRLEPH
jgi:hypothetical protein